MLAFFVAVGAILCTIIACFRLKAEQWAVLVGSVGHFDRLLVSSLFWVILTDLSGFLVGFSRLQ
ncbi:MAG: hypothetical protein CMB79_16710 [Filomicrobium sp.]|nr:hypothetical protein [Filomicrobium sp.]